MDFTDYNWDDIEATFVKENILGSEFSFSTKTELTISIDYIPKIQARKIYTFAKEQLEVLKNGAAANFQIAEDLKPLESLPVEELLAQKDMDEAEIIPVSLSGYRDEKQHPDPTPEFLSEESFGELSSEALFEKLQNYKKLLDNGLILQSEYDALKKEILSYM